MIQTEFIEMVNEKHERLAREINAMMYSECVEAYRKGYNNAVATMLLLIAGGALVLLMVLAR